jgi:hypothetical protein
MTCNSQAAAVHAFIKEIFPLLPENPDQLVTLRVKDLVKLSSASAADALNMLVTDLDQAADEDRLYAALDQAVEDYAPELCEPPAASVSGIRTLDGFETFMKSMGFVVIKV